MLLQAKDILLLQYPVPYIESYGGGGCTAYCPWCGIEVRVGDSFEDLPKTVPNQIAIHLARPSGKRCREGIATIGWDVVPLFGREVFDSSGVQFTDPDKPRVVMDLRAQV